MHVFCWLCYSILDIVNISHPDSFSRDLSISRTDILQISYFAEKTNLQEGFFLREAFGQSSSFLKQPFLEHLFFKTALLHYEILT